MTTHAQIDTFLGQSRFAMVGVSRNEKDFSAQLFREFLKQGYDVIPVNPAAAVVQGRTSARKLQDIRPAVDSALLMTPQSLSRTILADCLESGVRRVWIYGVMGPKDVDPENLKFCEQHSIELIAGYCPYMFMRQAPFYHRLHGFFARVFGAYPK